MHVTSHTEVNTSFLLQLKADWKVSKIKDLVSLTIHLTTTVVSFLHFRIFSKRLVFAGLARRFRQKVVSYLSASPENSEGPPIECFAKLL